MNSLCSWRKRSHFCHANALSQQWFLTPEAAASSGGIVAPELVSDGAEAPAATAVQLLQDAQEQARLREEAAAEQERQAAVEPKRKEQQMEADSISSEAPHCD